MVKAFILTIPRTVPKKALKVMIEKNDCKKWIIGFEVGNDGYRHYQARLVSSNHDFFEWVKAHIPTAHVEEASTDKFDYERKSGNFISSDDTPEIRQVRFGDMQQHQEEKVNWLKHQSVREIDFWYDPKGHSGKSWMVNKLWEIGGCHYIRNKSSADRIIADLCSKEEKQRRPYVLIDIPRASTVTDGLIEALESIKDGLLDDDRYAGTTINVRGIKVLVMTNNKIKNIDKLS